MSQVIAIGQAANEMERQTIAYLRDHLPDTYTVLHNLELHHNQETAAIDLIVVAPHAIYVVDVKQTQSAFEVGSDLSSVEPVRRAARLVQDLLRATNPNFRQLYVGFVVVAGGSETQLTEPNASLIVTPETSVALFQNADGIPDGFTRDAASDRDLVTRTLRQSATPGKRPAPTVQTETNPEESGTVMDHTSFENLLLDMSRLEYDALAENITRERAHCLRREQAEQIAVNPSQFTAAWRDHTADCRRCQVLLESCRETMWHPTWSQLSLWLLNRLSPTQTSQVQDHIQGLDCVRCKSIAADQIAKFAQVATAFTLKNLRVPAAASDETLEITQTLSDELEVEVSEDDGQLVIDVRTQQDKYDGQLVAYAVRGGEGQEYLRGFMLLRRRMPAWISAESTSDYMDLYDRAGAQLEIVVFPVHPYALTHDDRNLLLEAVTADSSDAKAVESWKTWVDAARAADELLGDDTVALIDAIEERLE